jgi:hypothetical protein
MGSKGRVAAGLGKGNGARVEETRRSMLARAGLAAGGVGLVVLARPERAAASTMRETLGIVPPAGDPALNLVPSGAVPPSVSAGGALNLDNTASTGAGAVLYSNQGSGAQGRLLVVHQANPANPQHAVRIENAGTAHTVSIFHNPAGGAGDSTAEAVDIVSTNPLDTTLGISGCEQGRGTVKITHEKPSGSDADAAALSIALRGTGTACQGIFIGNDAGYVTTGDLLRIRNGGPGSERLVLTADGRLALPISGPVAGVLLGSDANLYRASPGVLATDAQFQAQGIQQQFRLQPIANGGTGFLANVFGFHSPATLNKVGTGWTVNNYSVLRIEPPAGGGTITNLTGIDIRDLNSRGVSNYSVRSLGEAVHMRHSGGINLGSQATPDSLLHLRGNPSFHGSITLNEETRDPAPPTASDQARLYIKNGKLVIQWNDGGGALYTTIRLDSSGPYPALPAIVTSRAAP